MLGLSLWAASLGGMDGRAVELGIRPAVELVFPAEPGRAYQVEVSGDLGSWERVEQTVFGVGETARLLLPASQGPRFFRLHEYPVRDLNPLLEPIRAANQVPALTCAVVLSNRIVAVGAVGVRKAGVSAAPVTIHDRWHHGSLTKSMTATLAAILVERGRIRWDSTLAEVFPGLAASMHTQWRGATLEQLSSNRGGAPGNLNTGNIWNQLWAFGGTPTEGRRFLLEKLTVLAPASPPGTRYEYSNAGFALAGHMLETVMNKPWEDLMVEELFRPLGMSSAGFGVPATPRHIDQPWGHQWTSGKAAPVEPGTSADNPPGIGPAGTVHASVLDLAKYVAFHLAGVREGHALLPRAAFQKLQAPYPDNSDYGHGWVVVSRPWAGDGPALTHSGSNVQWFAVIWMAPARQFGVVAISNIAASSGNNPGANATDQAAWKMIQEFLN